jgi:hypothetical protein
LGHCNCGEGRRKTRIAKLEDLILHQGQARTIHATDIFRECSMIAGEKIVNTGFQRFFLPFDV